VESGKESVRIVGRYALYGAIASGGMATVHFGRLLGPVGFSRTVAIKRLHAQFAQDPEFVSMFLDEARLAARIRHPNVVPTLDVVATGGELFLVMDYVQGESLARLTRGKERANLRIISAIVSGALHGLHAAHEARDERGMPLGIVHRDVSPQNVLVGVDGVPKILDFGVAKAAGRSQTTRDGQIKGKLAYMPPEQLRGATLTRTTDIYATGVLLWEMLTGQRLFQGDNEGVIVTRILEGKVTPPSRVIATHSSTLTDAQMRLLEAIDAIVLKALAPKPDLRYATAREMALALENVCHPATASVIGEWVETTAREVLSTRAARIAEIESRSQDFDLPALMKEIQAPPAPTSSPASGPASAASAASAPSVSVPTPPPSGGIDPKRTLPLPSNQGQWGGPMSAHQMVISESTSPMPVPRNLVHVEPTPPVTQPSSISVATGRHSDLPATERRSHLGLMIAGAGALAVAMIVAAVIVRQGRTAAASPESTASDSIPAATTPPVASTLGGPGAIVAPTAAATSSGAPTATANATTTATAAVTATAATSPTAAATAKPPIGRPTATVKATGQPTATAAPPPPATAPADGCNPPFYFDAQGVKRYKPQCL